MTADNYTPSTSLTSYYATRLSRAPARHWATEKLVHDAGAIGQMSFFEGPGPNPMALSGASTAKLWLDTEAGVTDASGTLKYYKGSGSSSDEANWLAVTPAAYLAHLGGLSPVTSAEDFATKAAVQAASISGAVTYLRTAGHTNAGDGGGGLYKKVGSQPAHGAKIQSADGAWWEIAENAVTPQMLGAFPDGTAYTAELQAWLDVVRYWPAGPAKAPTLYLSPGTFVTGSRLVYNGYTHLVGNGIFSSILKLEDGADDHVLVSRSWESASIGTDYPVLFSSFTIDGNKTNQSSTTIDGLVYMGFFSHISKCFFTNCARHGVRATTIHRDGTEDAQSLVDTRWSGNRYFNNNGSGWFGETGVTLNRLADQIFTDEALSSNGSVTFAQLHAQRSAGFELINVRTYSGNAKDDVYLNLFSRGSVIGGNFELEAGGVDVSVADAAALRIVPAGGAQRYISITGGQFMIGDSVVDNGVTRYNGIFIDGSSDYVSIQGCAISTNGTIGQGLPLRVSGTVGGIYACVEEGFPTASQLSNLDVPAGYFVGNTGRNLSGVGNIGFHINGTGFTDSGQHLARFSADSDGSYLVLAKSRGASIGTYTVVQSNDVIGRVQWRAADGVTTSAAAEIRAVVDGTPGASDMPGRLVFATTADGAASVTDRALIDSKGNVVVNTAAIATNATDGFLYVPTCAGTPTGVPTTYTGRAPIIIDSTNNKLYFYSGGAWRDAGP